MDNRSGALALVTLCLLELALQGATEPLVPAMFVFGDSTVDVGNNNFLKKCTVNCTANHAHYGVDYPDHAPTGRFSNGYNLADRLAQLLGFTESPPPFLSLPNASLFSQISTGINFASGGSGLLDGTGHQVCGQVVSMAEQVGKFTSLARVWGNESQMAADIVSKSLFFISVGSNDLFEYADTTVPNRNDREFLQGLIVSYRSYVKDLYGAGAKRFSVVSPSLVGCCPSQRLVAQQSNNQDKLGCFGAANNLSTQLYPMIASMLHDLSLELPGMNYSLGDSISMAESVFKNPQNPAFNFTVLDKACCGAGAFGAGECDFLAPLCKNRINYLFWDKFHPSEAASGVTAQGLYSGNGSYVHPINVQQLVKSQP